MVVENTGTVICKHCKHRIYSFGFNECRLHGHMNNVTGKITYDSCGSINWRGDCPDFAQKQTFFEKLKMLIDG